MDEAEKGLNTVRGKTVAGLLVTLFVTLIVGYLWWGRFEYYKPLLLGFTYTGSFFVVLFGHLYFRDSLRDLGIRLDNLVQGLRIAAVPNLILIGIILLWGLWSGEFSLSWQNATLLYFPWAFLQQHLLQNFLLARTGNIFGRRVVAVVIAALVFALIHLPNAALVVASLVGALVWCRIFLRVPNLFVVSFSHALLGILLVVFFKFSGFDQLQVGRSGFAFRTYGDGVIVAAGYDRSRQPFIATLPGHDRGTRSLLRVFEPSGKLRFEWIAFPDHDFSGKLAIGELGFGQGDEIVVSPGPGIRNPPEVRIFSISGTELNRFALERYHGYGAAVAIAGGRILVCPGPGPERTARVFEYLPNGALIKEWDFGELGFNNGVRAQRLEVRNEDGKTGISRLLLWANVLSVNPSNIQVYDEPTDNLASWETYGTAFGLHLALIQLKDGKSGFITGPGSAPGHGPRVKVFDQNGRELQNFFGYEDEEPCGTHVAAVDVDGNLVDEIVLGEGICPGQPPIVRIVNRTGKLLAQWEAY
jgi:membrane protease YdiL (CAAX protease family)